MKLISGGQNDMEGSLIYQHSSRMKPGGTLVAAPASDRGCVDGDSSSESRWGIHT